MENFNEMLIDLLKKDSRFIDKEDNILRSKIIDAALNADKPLISLLSTNKKVKEAFFSEVSGYWIFEANKFIDYIQDKNFLNDSYTKYRNKIGLTIDGKFLNERNEVALSFPFKDCILEGGQTVQENNRKEIFFNEILAQDEIDKLLAKKVLINFKRYTEKGEEKVVDFKRDPGGTIRENLIIKGNNLLALHTIRDQFKGKIKLIYIDPPYNTGNDEFNYNDNFNHSTWLTFMKNRLEIAKELLRDDGVIFVSIADREMAYLKVLMDQIFDNNFIQTVAIKRATTAGFKAINLCPVTTKEFLLIYGKTRTKNTLNPVYVEVNNLDNYDTFIENINEDPKKWKFKSLHEVFYNSIGVKNPIEASKKLGSNWKLQRDTFEYNFKLTHPKATISFRDVHKPSESISKLMKKSRENPDEVFIFERKNKDNMYFLKGRSITFLKNKIKNVDGRDVPAEILTDIWYDISWDGIAKEGGVILKNGKKPEKLIKRIINLTFRKDERGVVLDYHVGSGTTCAVAHKLGLQYIGIEQLDYGENDSVNRLKNVIKGDQTGISKLINWKGGGEFIYLELARYNQTFIDWIDDAKSTNELLKILKEIEYRAFLKYNVDLKELDSRLDEFKKLTLKEQKETLISILNKNQLYVNLSDIDDSRFSISDEDKQLNKKFYSQ